MGHSISIFSSSKLIFKVNESFAKIHPKQRNFVQHFQCATKATVDKLAGGTKNIAIFKLWDVKNLSG